MGWKFAWQPWQFLASLGPTFLSIGVEFEVWGVNYAGRHRLGRVLVPDPVLATSRADA